MIDQRIADRGAGRRRWWRDRDLQNRALIFIVAGFLFWSHLAGAREASDRRDQTCVIFERQHIDAVRQLKDTYNYLAALSPADRDSALNRAILAQLPTNENAAISSRPPDYCLPVDVGLPEPLPKIPPRPPDLFPR